MIKYSIQKKHSTYKLWTIYCSFCIAILLQTILCIPQIWNIYPSWVLILLMYWIMMSPCQVNIGTGFTLGLILDIILGSILGIHALSLSILSYLVIRKVYFFKHISVWMQSFFIILFSLINQGIILLITFVFIKVTYSPKILWSCVLDGGIWPIIIISMHKLYNINNNI